MRDPDNKASWFALRNLNHFPSAFSLSEADEQSARPTLFDVEEKDEDHVPEIEVIGIPSAIGQAKQLFSLLETLPSDADTALRDRKSVV